MDKAEKEKLMEVRNRRVRPGLDDKILTGWNAMTVQGLTDAYHTFGENKFLALAEGNIRFIEENLIHEEKVYRSFKNKRSTTEGFLEDYAFLIQAYTALYQSTFNEEYIIKAERWCANTLTHFFDKEEGYFHFTSLQAEPLIARKKEVFDNVIPSSNSVMARNLYRLGILLDKEEWKKTAVAMVAQLGSIIQSEPGYMSHWGMLLSEMIQGMAEVVIVGPAAEEMRKEFSSHYQPFAMVMGTTSKSELPLFEGRASTDGKTRIYVCHNKVCKLPVESVVEAVNQLN